MFKFLTDIFSNNKDIRFTEKTHDLNNESIDVLQDSTNGNSSESNSLVDLPSMSETKYLEDLINKASDEESTIEGIPADLQILAPGEQRQLESSMTIFQKSIEEDSELSSALAAQILKT